MAWEDPSHMVAPLEGMRVVEVASFVPGPAAGLSLVCGILAARRNRWRIAEARSPFWTCPPYLRIITRGETPGDSGRTK
jgi:hypothetical protein